MDPVKFLQTILQGKLTYLSAAGIIAIGCYQLAQGQVTVEGFFEYLFAGSGFAGLKRALQNMNSEEPSK